MEESQTITLKRRVSTDFLESISQDILDINVKMYLVVKRKQAIDCEYGGDARIDPCELNLRNKTISFTINKKYNPGIESFDDLEPTFFESAQAAFTIFCYSL